MQKTTEQLAKECGARQSELVDGISFRPDELEAFRLASIRDYFENAEPYAVEVETGDGTELAYTAAITKYRMYPISAITIPLYAAPKE